MKNWSHRAVAGALLLALIPALPGCVTSAKDISDTIAEYRLTVSGQYQSAAGARLYIAPVRARMVTDEALYLERHDPNGNISGRLLNVEVGKDEEIITRALVFTQEGQWRNLRESRAVHRVAAEGRATGGQVRHRAGERPQFADLLLRRSPGRNLHAGERIARRARYFVCASSQSSTVPYHWMLLLGFSTQ